MYKRTTLVIAVCVLVSFASPQSRTPTDASSAFTAALREIAAAGKLPDLRWPDFFDYRLHVANFYDSIGYAPAWLI
ncbi:MAG: hypothetical protein WB711_16340, partial [Terriglobales bacterium]